MSLEVSHKDQEISLVRIFKESFYISAFTFGGGYVMLPLMRNRFVEQLHWIDEEEMMDLFAIAQTAPGAMAVNAAILIGYRLKGLKGTVAAIVATVLPPLVIMTLVSYFYIAFSQNVIIAAALRGMQAGVAAIIVDVVIRMAMDIFKKKWLPAIIIMFASFVAVYVFKVNIAMVLICSSILGLTSEKVWPKKEVDNK
ncbi:chromate transporter [Granulicatella balaenopterae]|uniref:Chromate transporter n=1 Tax=Granulicatella balaenopterae TaxID=137733 RepID=A0A1H9I3S4_9LACT|nr:chromate transporter [Granulicatella balaenopterae]SEQ69142.1 chromate transporter [Granulicatella balaenopterae]